MSNEKKKNDFFNLHSDTDSDDLENEKSEKIKKWDWNAPENNERFYQTHISLKRTLQNGSTADEKKSTKRLKDSALPAQGCSQTKASSCIEKTIDNFGHPTINLVSHNGPVNRVHWSNRCDNKNMLLSSSMDSKMVLWNLNESKLNVTAKCLTIFPSVHSKGIRNAIWFNDENEIASVSFDQSSAITDISTSKNVNRLEFKCVLSAVCSHPSNNNIMLVGGKNEVHAWDTRTNKTTHTYKSLMGQVQDITFLNEKEFIVCGDVVSRESAQHSIMAWDFDSTAVLSDQVFHEKFIATCLKKHPTNASFYAQTHGNYIAEFSTKTPYRMNKHKRFESPDHLVNGYSIGFDINKYGSMLATGSSTGHALIYNVSTSKLITKLNAFTSSIVTVPCLDAKFNSFKKSDDKSLLAVSGWNGMIKIFEI